MTGVTFTCRRCNAVVEPDASTWRCRCGGPFTMSPSSVTSSSVASSSVPSSSVVSSSVPPPRSLPDVTMGEGATPLVRVQVDGRSVCAKLEFESPTGSFKDRGAAMLVAAALDAGATRIVADSSGNAGAAIAMYAAHVDLPCEVFIPSTASDAKIERIVATGAAVHLVTGTREDVARAAVAFVESSGAFYASHVWNPWFFEGTKHYVREIHAALGRLPATLVLPVGNGTLVLGADRAFAELGASSPIVAVQAATCAPIAAAFAAGRSHVEAVVDGGTIARGIAIGAPVRGEQILEVVRRSAGAVVTVTDDEIAAARAVLAADGFDVDATAAVPLAAWRRHGFDDAVIPISAGYRRT